MKEEALHRTMWRHRFGGGFGPVVRQNTERMNSQKLAYLSKISMTLTTVGLTHREVRANGTSDREMGE